MRGVVVPWVPVAAAPLEVVLDGVTVEGHLLTLVVNSKGADFQVFLLPLEAAFLLVEDFKEDSPVAQPGPLPMFLPVASRVALLRSSTARTHIRPRQVRLDRQT
jgi:hypothetical protein